MVKSSDKKLLIGSALAGLMIAGSGISVTASPGKFFQTAKLEVGYRVAQQSDRPTWKPDAVWRPRSSR